MARKSFSSNVYQSFEKDIREISIAFQQNHARQVKAANQIKGLLKEIKRASDNERGRTEKLRGGSKSLNKLTTAEFVLKALMSAKRPIRVEDIQDRMVRLGWVTSGRNPMATICTTLYKLARDPKSQVKRVSFGRYKYDKAYQAPTRKAANE